MKYCYLLLLLFVTWKDFAQESTFENHDDEIVEYSKIDIKPEYPGGDNLLYVIIMKNFKAPDRENIKGKVIVNYIIEKDGTMSNMKIIEDVGYGSGKELIRVLKSCLNWKPGEHNGKIVRTSHQIRISVETRG